MCWILPYIITRRLLSTVVLLGWIFFFGFSCFHFLTVALVQNLHTGHVCSQYHVVFGDKFDTIFNDWRTNEEIDQLCQTLFTWNFECYIWEEHDQDGMFICEGVLFYLRNKINWTHLRDKGKVLKEGRSCSLRRYVGSRSRKRDLSIIILHSLSSQILSRSQIVILNLRWGQIKKGGDDDGIDKDLWKDHPVRQ